MSGPVALQALITGLATGATYGLIALGFSLVHRLTGVIAFAHGDIVVGAVFAAVLVVEQATIRSHIRRILMKLELRDRVQIVIFAYDRNGSLGFSGGLTSARGQPGRSAAQERLLSLVSGQRTTPVTGAVFGCALHREESR